MTSTLFTFLNADLIKESAKKVTNFYTMNKLLEANSQDPRVFGLLQNSFEVILSNISTKHPMFSGGFGIFPATELEYPLNLKSIKSFSGLKYIDLLIQAKYNELNLINTNVSKINLQVPDLYLDYFTKTLSYLLYIFSKKNDHYIRFFRKNLDNIEYENDTFRYIRNLDVGTNNLTSYSFYKFNPKSYETTYIHLPLNIKKVITNNPFILIKIL